MAKSTKYYEKRNTLKQLSNQVKEVAKENEMTINQALKQFLYDPNSEMRFNSFMQWKDQGFKVKKGEKAFLFWSKPVKVPITEEKSKKDEYSYFPLAYLFSNQQVEKN